MKNAFYHLPEKQRHAADLGYDWPQPGEKMSRHHKGKLP
jgi:hypothetical protein